MKVNALKPRVLVSKVRKSISDLECLNCLHGHNIRALWKEHPYPIPLTLSPKPSTQVKAFLWEDNGVTQLDRICSSVLWSERVFKEHQCSNAATFPVYKPPATLPGMVSGLWTKRGKASGQMDNKALWLIHYLQILKVVDLGRKGTLVGQQAEECGRHFLTARGLQVVDSQKGHFKHELNIGKDHDLGKWFL